MVLLDMLVKKDEDELVVAHFDHGIRPESDADARFVGALASSYGLKFETKREELGGSASEELARERRYAFLREIAAKHNAAIVTAHHANDMRETIAINLTRGTGWRGLAVLNDQTIVRPLLQLAKSDIYKYALLNGLEWVEDETNASTMYLRNRIRQNIARLDGGTNQKLDNLRHRQSKLVSEIDIEAENIARSVNMQSRYFFTNIDEASALELLRAALEKKGVSATRPQRKRMLHAIRTIKPGSILQAGTGFHVVFSTSEFVVKTE